MTVTIDGTTGIASVDASASTPSLRGADSNSGIFYTADAIKFSTGGTQRVVIDNNGLNPSGHVIQVVSGQTNTKATIGTSVAETEITTDMRATIVPKLATSKLIIRFHLHLVANPHIGVRIKKDGTSYVFDADRGFAASNAHGNGRFGDHHNPSGILAIQVEETAGSTSSRYYSPFWNTNSGTSHYGGFNRWDSANGNYDFTSSYQVTEVAA